MDAGTLNRRLVGRLAAVLFMASGLITLASVAMPAPEGFNKLALVGVSAIAMLAGAVAWVLPWERWRREASLVLAPLAFAIIGLGNSLQFSVPYTDGIYFVVAFVWLGVGHRRGIAWRASLLAAPAYVVPILIRGGDVATNVGTAAVVLPVCALVGESLSWVTERLRTAEEELRSSQRSYERAYELERLASERLRSLDNLKNGLVAAVSHEIRTPLTSVLGLALTLQRQGDNLPPERTATLAGELAESARRLDHLLSDLLDVDRLARGVLEPRRTPTEIGTIVRAVVDRVDVEDHPVLIETEPVVCAVDVAQVERIVENLLANAVRHTAPRTRIFVRCERADDGVIISVDDEGPGIPAEWRDRIFEPFTQHAAPSHAPGMGVGLTLVERFADLHGGRAWMQDRPEGGASFRVFLPFDAQHGVTLPQTVTLADAG